MSGEVVLRTNQILSALASLGTSGFAARFRRTG